MRHEVEERLTSIARLKADQITAWARNGWATPPSSQRIRFSPRACSASWPIRATRMPANFAPLPQSSGTFPLRGGPDG